MLRDILFALSPVQCLFWLSFFYTSEFLFYPLGSGGLSSSVINIQGGAASRFTVVCRENTMINEQYKNALCMLRTHNCEPTCAPPCT